MTSTSYATFGHLKVRTDRYHDGISLTVMVGPHYNNTLSRPFVNAELEAGRVWYAHLRAEGLAGTPVHEIENQMSALIEAGLALTAVEQNRTHS